MKRFHTLLLLFVSFGLFAQTAPDFTVTDTHGEEHSLYEDYLDKGITVVLDLFFVNCGPCNDLAPLLEPVYQEWGAGAGDVQFISLTGDPYNEDTNELVIGFEELHGTTWPAASNEGGGPEAQQPYEDNTFGEFIGYPTLVVISPDRSVQFDAWGNNLDETIQILQEWIENTGATRPISNVIDLDNVNTFAINPNPVSNEATISLDLEKEVQTNIAIFNTLGQQVKNIYTGSLSAGAQSVEMTTAELVSGTYFIKVTMNDQSKMQQFIKI